MCTEFSLQFHYNDANNVLQYHHIGICLIILSVQEQSSVFTTSTAEQGQEGQLVTRGKSFTKNSEERCYELESENLK